jgi:hypothetical protein
MNLDLYYYDYGNNRNDSIIENNPVKQLIRVSRVLLRHLNQWSVDTHYGINTERELL